jgi:hypothetical protein
MLGENSKSITSCTCLTSALDGGEMRRIKLSGSYLNVYLTSTSFSYIPDVSTKKFILQYLLWNRTKGSFKGFNYNFYHIVLFHVFFHRAVALNLQVLTFM